MASPIGAYATPSGELRETPHLPLLAAKLTAYNARNHLNNNEDDKPCPLKANNPAVPAA